MSGWLAASAGAGTWHALTTSFGMVVETFWALVLGFGLSGAIRAGDGGRLRATLGDRRPRTLARASAYGMASSSCSYAAAAMARSLVRKGADFVSSMAFMIASTNLVVELGLVLVALLGWRFAAAEFVGGTILIGVFAVLGSAVLTPRVLGTLPRAELEVPPTDRDVRRATGTSQASWSARLGSAASYAVGDVRMLWRELVVGYLVAGLLAALVPAHAWDALFVRGHGGWTVVENALVGPIVALLSCVCSIGNVPLAAALWSGGIGFAGVVSFLLADLIAAPLLLVYRRLHGAAVAVRLAAVLYVSMVLAGLATDVLFAAAAQVPTVRRAAPLAGQLSWGPTTVLDVVAAMVAVLGVWALRHGAAEAADGTVVDPSCGMRVHARDAPARALVDGRTHSFCSERCRERFLASGTRSAEARVRPDLPTPPGPRTGRNL